MNFGRKLDEVEKGEDKDPNQINKVPVQTDFFDGFVGTPSIKNSGHGHDRHDNIDNNPTKNVETMKAGDGKKQVGEIDLPRRTVGVQKGISPPPCTVVMKVGPFPGLATQESNTPQNGP